MSCDSRKRILQEKQDQIKAECVKFNSQIQNIIGQSERAVEKLSSLNNCDFLKSFTSVYEFLNKLHVKVLDANCTFELFALELHGDTDAKELVSECAADNSSITDINLDADNNRLIDNLKDSNANTAGNNPNVDEFVTNKSSTSIDAQSTTTVPSDGSESKSALTIDEKKKLFDSFFPKLQKKKKSARTEVVREPLRILSTNANGNADILAPKQEQPPADYWTLKERVEKRTRDRELRYCVQVPQVAIKPPKRPGHSAVGPPRSNHETESTDETVAKKMIEMKKATAPKEGDVCFVSCVNSPSDFYIQVVSDETALVDL